MASKTPTSHARGCSGTSAFSFSRDRLDEIYQRWNHREFAVRDPVCFLYRYKDPDDRALVGLLASSLAYGRVGHILSSVEKLLLRLGTSPHATVMSEPPKALAVRLRGFRHRFAGDRELAQLLAGCRGAIERHGSIKDCFFASLPSDAETVDGALAPFVAALGGGGNHLLPEPGRGSACKRLHLWLRWMVRHDEIDIGDWAGAGAHRLVIPYDTHMQRLARSLGLAASGSGSRRDALALTQRFRQACPEDPVRYDFALTREAIERGNA